MSDHTEYMRRYRETDAGREANRRNAALSRQRRKLKLLEGRTCERCPVTDLRVLQFHHPDGVEKEHVMGRYKKWDEAILEEARKCEVLCANCHFIEHNTWTLETK